MSFNDNALQRAITQWNVSTCVPVFIALVLDRYWSPPTFRSLGDLTRRLEKREREHSHLTLKRQKMSLNDS